jgi:hypothetical protein
VRTRLLDKVVRYRFGDNAELMGACESARNVGWVVPDKGGDRVLGYTACIFDDPGTQRHTHDILHRAPNKRLELTPPAVVELQL